MAFERIPRRTGPYDLDVRRWFLAVVAVVIACLMSCAGDGDVSLSDDLQEISGRSAVPKECLDLLQYVRDLEHAIPERRTWEVELPDLGALLPPLDDEAAAEIERITGRAIERNPSTTAAPRYESRNNNSDVDAATFAMVRAASTATHDSPQCFSAPKRIAWRDRYDDLR